MTWVRGRLTVTPWAIFTVTNAADLLVLSAALGLAGRLLLARVPPGPLIAADGSLLMLGAGLGIWCLGRARRQTPDSGQ